MNAAEQPEAPTDGVLFPEVPDLAPQTSRHGPPTGPTPSQTVGPFFAIGLTAIAGAALVEPGEPNAIALSGRVVDGDGAPVPDAAVEIWQADAGGRLGARPGFRGFGRCLVDDRGSYRFVTVRPGATGDGSAPHIAVVLFARGLLQRLATRIYLPGEPGNETDRVLAAAGHRRGTLIAEGSGDELHHDFHLQGEQETVFLAW